MPSTASSDRADKPLLKISCAAIPETLLESELFGYERGAFTGAAGAKPGKFELADGGTLLLDEIAEMSPQLQAKLLRVLQDGEFQRLGGTRNLKTDVRLLTATHEDILARIAGNQFRHDLYYRINTVQVSLPALRERREDIPLLARHFLAKFAAEMRREVQVITPKALDQLCAHSWPGNVRELEHVIQRAVALATGDTITSFTFAPAVSGAGESAAATRNGPANYHSHRHHRGRGDPAARGRHGRAVRGQQTASRPHSRHPAAHDVSALSRS